MQTQNNGKAKVKGKFRDILGLINSALNGQIFSQSDGTYEIYFKNEVHGLFASLFIKRDRDGNGNRKTTVSFKKGFLKNKMVQNIVTFRDLQKVYVAITPSLSVSFLYIEGDTFTVIEIHKSTKSYVVTGKNYRTKMSESPDDYTRAINNSEATGFGNNFHNSKFGKDLDPHKTMTAEEKVAEKRKKRKIFVSF